MLKILFFTAIMMSFSFSRVIGGISALVNGMPITTFEIKQFAKTNHVSLNDALTALIQQKIIEIETAKAGIIVTPEEIDNEIMRLAKANKMDMKTFSRALAKEGKNINDLKKQIVQKIKKDKLYEKILKQNLNKPTEEDLKRFYELHKKELNAPYKVDVIQYVSMDKDKLIQKLKTPAFPIDGVHDGKTSLPLDNIPPQLSNILVKTPNGKLTPVLNIGGGKFVAFKVLKKYTRKANFNDVKQRLLGAYMQERQQAKLIEYFEKKKSEANVKIIRKP